MIYKLVDGVIYKLPTTVLNNIYVLESHQCFGEFRFVYDKYFLSNGYF